MSDIVILANGSERRCPRGSTVSELLHALELSPPLVLVEVNGEPLERERYGQVALAPGDRVEIAQMVGGG